MLQGPRRGHHGLLQWAGDSVAGEDFREILGQSEGDRAHGHQFAVPFVQVEGVGVHSQHAALRVHMHHVGCEFGQTENVLGHAERRMRPNELQRKEEKNINSKNSMQTKNWIKKPKILKKIK